MKLMGLQIKVQKNVIYTFCVMVVVYAMVTGLLGVVSGDIQAFTLIEVLLVAVAATGFHFIAQFIHMIGHALAAQSTGYPMSTVLLLYGFAMSLYPKDEPPLPARLHIRRSLGGVIGFGIVLLIVAVLWFNTRDTPYWTLRYLTSYMLVNIAFLFAVSALVSDGVLFVLRKEWLPTQPDNSKAL